MYQESLAASELVGFFVGKKRLKEGSGPGDGIPWLCAGPGHVQTTVCGNEWFLHGTVIFGLYGDGKCVFVVLGPVLRVLGCVSEVYGTG